MKNFLACLVSVTILGSCSYLSDDSSSRQIAMTMSATPIPVASQTKIATSTPLPTVIVKSIQTPLPTLDSQNPSLIVKDLLENNRNCQLPCWWGVIPSQTSWESTHNSISPIANSVYISSSENSESAHAEIFIPAPDPFSGEFRQEFLIKNGIVERIEILPQHFSKYSLPKGLLQEFGNPEMIFLVGSIEQPQSFQLILHYPNRGILALYSNELRPFQEQEMLNVCFTQDEIKYVDMFLWDSSDSFSDETLNYLFTEYERPFYEIELVTDLTKDDLNNVFTSSDPKNCFQTPSHFWRN